MIMGHVAYEGKEYKLMDFKSALAEFTSQKEKGLKPVIVSYGKGYIVAEAKFKEDDKQ